MKSVTGEIKSTTPVTLSRAATILSNFVAADTGASQAVTAYLRRATSAFDELVDFHGKYHHRRYEKHKSDTAAAAGPTTSLATVVDSTKVEQSKTVASAELNEQDRLDNSSDSKKKSKKSGLIEEEQRKGEGNGEVEEESISKKKKEKKNKSGPHTSTNEEKSEGVHVDGDLGGERRKKKKKDKSKAKENGEVDGYKENGDSIITNHEGSSGKRRIEEEEQKSEGLNVKEENRKKRKSGEADEQRRDDQSEERPRKKRK